MALKIEQTCSRCHRVEGTPVENAAEATEIDAALNKKVAGAAKVKALFAQLQKDGEMPDVVGAVPEGEPVIHANLCDPAEGSGKDGAEKRSCVKLMVELIGRMGAIGPRKPKKKKGDTAVPEVDIEETPATK